MTGMSGNEGRTHAISRIAARLSYDGMGSRLNLVRRLFPESPRVDPARLSADRIEARASWRLAEEPSSSTMGPPPALVFARDPESVEAPVESMSESVGAGHGVGQTRRPLVQSLMAHQFLASLGTGNPPFRTTPAQHARTAPPVAETVVPSSRFLPSGADSFSTRSLAAPRSGTKRLDDTDLPPPSGSLRRTTGKAVSTDVRGRSAPLSIAGRRAAGALSLDEDAPSPLRGPSPPAMVQASEARPDPMEPAPLSPQSEAQALSARLAERSHVGWRPLPGRIRDLDAAEAASDNDPPAAPLGARTRDLVASLARASDAHGVVETLMNTPPAMVGQDIPAPILRLVEQIRQEAGDLGEQDRAHKDESRRPVATESVRRARRQNRAPPTEVAGPSDWGTRRERVRSSPVVPVRRPLDADKVMTLVKKLTGLVALAEKEHRRLEAQKHVRMAEDSGEARAEGSKPAKSQEQADFNVDIEAVGREVLDVMSLELETRQDRRLEDTDGRRNWW